MPKTMYDSITLDTVPTDAYAVAGYVGGEWPTYETLSKRFPNARHLSIAVQSTEDADCLDIETGDATPAQAPAWVRRQIKRGVKKPVVYSSVSQMPAVLLALEASGLKRSNVRLWTAHYTFTPHLCSAKCGFGFKTKADATQYTDKALGRNLDASLVSNSFFGTGVTAAVKRKALRAWIVARHAQGWTWVRLKRTAQWAQWRKIGGK